MTKNGRRNHRKKSCSSAESASNVESSGEENHVKEKGGKDVHLPAVQEASKSQHSAVGESIRGWFSSLSWGDRASVTSIEDTAFITTLLDLASSWSSPHHSSGMEATWSAKFSVQQVEKVYNSNLAQAKSLNFAEGKATFSSEEIPALNKTLANQSTAAPTVESTPEEVVKEQRGELGAAKDTNASVDGSAPPTVESDAFRIRAAASQPISDKATNATKGEKKSYGDETMKSNGLMDHLRIVFPSAYNLVLTHPAFEHIQQRASSEVLESPTITLDPRSLGNCTVEEVLRHFNTLLRPADLNEAFLSEERCSMWRRSRNTDAKSHWIALLKPLVQKSSDSVPLSLLVAVRMEASAFAAYDQVKGSRPTNGGDATAIANVVVDGKPELVNETSDDTQGDNTWKTSRLAFHVVSEAVESYAARVPSSRSARYMDHVRTLIPKKFRVNENSGDELFVLLPFSCVVHGRETTSRGKPSSASSLMSWNSTVEMALKTLIDDMETSQNVDKYKDGVRMKEGSNGKSPCGHDAAVQTESLAQAPVKKNKKKKKKKRKASSADQSIVSSDLVSDNRPAVVDECPGDRTDEEVSATATENHADLLNKTTNAVRTPKPPPEEASTVGQSVSGCATVRVDFPADEENENRRSASVVQMAKDANEHSVADKSIATIEKAASTVTKELADSPRDATASLDTHDSAEDHSAWETVEAKSRGNRNRRACAGQARNEKTGGNNTPSQGSGTSGTGTMGSRRSKKPSTSRRRNGRKIVKEILSSVLDSVDVEVKRRRMQVAKAVGGRTSAPGRLSQVTNGSKQASAWQARPMNMKDVVLGRVRADPASAPDAQSPPAVIHSTKKESADVASGLATKNDADAGKKPKSPSHRIKPRGAWVADQSNISTAPTVPETLSGISATTQSSGVNTVDGDNASTSCISGRDKAAERTAAIDYSSFVDVASSKHESKGDGKETSPVPPLQTLPWPANTNSASSSVASSLEVPHGRHLHTHHSSITNENEVGYHLLDVCDRLSRDMDVFMGRRAVALGARRRERCALLAALQDIASKLWAGRCHVEMYGSCATQLDLPSSDLDAVICGIDRRLGGHMNVPLVVQQSDSQDDLSAAPSLASQESQTDIPLPHPYSPRTAQYINVPALSPNAERVIRLAAELERQSWVVQVKAIPTATVPVVKILADPSRLPGAVASVMSGGDWMMQQHHMAAHAAAAGMNQTTQSGTQVHPQGTYYAPNSASAHGHGPHYVHHSPPPWRGADVMNGLFSVDITFEGPEHGGIGSTEYSARFVQDACNEVGLPPDRAPIVQTLMVLKELLAQRRLNEPFSGGLSSYALLLLLDAVLKERRAIKQEMEKIERQRLVVASGGSSVGKPSGQKRGSAPSQKPTDGNAKGGSTGSASTIAQKSSQPPAPTISTRSSGRGKSIQRSGTSVLTGQAEPAKPEPEAKKNVIAASKDQEKNSKMKTNTNKSVDPPTPKSGSSWACIAKKNTGAAVPNKAPPRIASKAAPSDDKSTKPQPPAKPSSFADAVSNGVKTAETSLVLRKPQDVVVRKPQVVEGKKQLPQQQSKKVAQPVQPKVAPPYVGLTVSNIKDVTESRAEKSASPSSEAVESGSSSGSNSSDSGFAAPSLFPQGSNDVLEVLCSGETTAGKLLLHFLLYYGRHFDSHAMAIDLSGKHHPDRHLVGKRGHHNIHLSPYVPRTGGGSIDPVTGMLTVDPIVVYDPLEGAEDNNVARSCFAWSSIRWVFAQSYMTLSSAVERSATPPATPGGTHGEGEAGNRQASSSARVDHRPGSAEESRESPVNTVSPLLELLLSF